MKNHDSEMENKKNKKYLPYIISSVATVVCLALFTGIFVYMGAFDKLFAGAKDNQDVLQALSQEQTPVIDFTEVSTLEMRGMWIPTTLNIAFPSKAGLDDKTLAKELDDIVNKAYENKINSLFFQVRPTADALYNSDIFPSSIYLTENQTNTENSFDCLEYLLKKAAEYNIDVHAWVNPYRVTMSEKDKEKMSTLSPAVKYSDLTVLYADGKTYFDPGEPLVQSLVVDGVKELVEKYPTLAGVHFDDYFYPYPSGNAEFDDEDTYKKYGGTMDKSDWRRQNVNTLIEQTYKAIKEINEDCVFGVSVFGIWANKSSNTPVVGSETNGLEAYNSLYCDALAWAKGGYVDYIAPQNYWSMDTVAAPFDDVARWWNANLDGTGVDLYIGHAAYKSGEYKEGEIYRQIEFCRTLSCYKGSIFYGYENICENVGGVSDDIKKACEPKIIRTKTTSNGKDITVNFPSNNSYVNTSKTYIIGSADSGYPLTMNGQAISKTTGGYFSTYVELSQGKNTFDFAQNGKTYTLTVNYGSKNNNSATGSSYKRMDKMEIMDAYPQGSTWLNVGDTLIVSCAAPSGSIVTATVGGMSVVMTPTINPPDESEYMYEKYVGSVKPSTFASSGEVVALGTLTFTAERNGETATLKCGLISQQHEDAYSYAEVNKDYTHTKISTKSSFYDDFLPSSKGMRDYVTSVEDGYCKLRFGGYVKESELAITYGKPLLLNTILTTALEVVSTDTTNNKCNSTDIRFGVTENIPVDVDFNGENSGMRIIMYNTDSSIIPEFEIPANPLVKSISGKKGTRENMVIYTVTLKDNKNFYGFNIVYENGCMIVKLNNPQTLRQGDKPLEGKTIVVDAGHGGTDIGAPGPGNLPESVLNRNIADELVKNLHSLGATVLESRTGNNTVDLYERMDFLNDACPDLAVSIHHNSVAGSSNAQKVRGFMALYSNNSGVLLAQTVSNVVCSELGREQKPTAYQQLAVARNHRFPSALFEMCFICNVEEYQWSITEGNYKRSADALTEGILEYYRIGAKYLEY